MIDFMIFSIEAENLLVFVSFWYILACMRAKTFWCKNDESVNMQRIGTCSIQWGIKLFFFV